MNNQKKGNAAIVGVIAVVVGLLVGYMVAGAMKGKAPEAAMEKTPTAATATGETKGASDLRVLLNGLDKQHVDLAAAATRAGFDGNKDFEAASGALLKNSDDITAAVSSVYGEENGAKFKEIWNSHITFFVNYTVAAKKGDKAGMAKAEKDLGGYIEAISDFLSKANPNLPREALVQLFTKHVTLLKAAVDAHGAGNYAESYAKQGEAYRQVGEIADGLSGAIVKQFPDKFN